MVVVDSTLHLVNDSELHSEGWWKWSVWVEGSPEDLAKIASVTYRLHPTFPNPVVHVTNGSTKFRLKSGGWGEFAIAADVTMLDRRTVRLERWLELGDAAKNKNDLLAEKRRPSVFLTYSVADKEIVAALSETLQQQGIDVLTEEQLVETSEELEPQFEKNLQHTDAVIALFSNPPSRWVEKEAVTAHQKGTYVVPVLVGGANVSSKLSGIQRFELADTRFVVGLAQQIAARVKDHVIPEES